MLGLVRDKSDNNLNQLSELLHRGLEYRYQNSRIFFIASSQFLDILIDIKNTNAKSDKKPRREVVESDHCESVLMPRFFCSFTTTPK